jgi:phenylpropionate dioxygenase-like ring-hydroxylating dioxygenase large terminal subunit
MTSRPADFPDAAVRADYVPKEDYLSREFLRQENERLWPRVWQIACRLEELPEVGDYVTYDIADDSVTVVRTAKDAIRAYHNVCPHRGRRLTNDAGRMQEFVCRYHGWRWDLGGECTKLVDEHDWGSGYSRKDARLQEVKVDTWGGWVFINMDPEAGPLSAFLSPVNELCAKFEFDKLRYKWYRTVVLPCNWKVVLEAFDEAYHVQTTHPQMLGYIEDYTNSGAYGRHGAFWYPPLPEGRSRYTLSSRLGRVADPDTRKYVLEYYDEMHYELDAMVTPRSYEAAQRLRNEVEADAPSSQVLQKLRQFQREAGQVGRFDLGGRMGGQRALLSLGPHPVAHPVRHPPGPAPALFGLGPRHPFGHQPRHA